MYTQTLCKYNEQISCNVNSEDFEDENSWLENCAYLA